MDVAPEIVGKFIDAAVHDHVEAKRLLTAHPALRSARWLGGEHLLNFIVIENFPAGVSFCLANGFDPNQLDLDNEMGTTPLHFACKLNYTEIAKLLVEAGADANAICQIDDTPIHCVVRNGNAELLDFLIQHGADPNYVTDLGETIFDNWPPRAKEEFEAVLKKHRVKR